MSIESKGEKLSARLGQPVVYVPAGPFLMGSDPAIDPQAEENELPQHVITLDEYWIGRFPVTNQAYARFISAGGYVNRKYWSAWGWRLKETGGPHIGDSMRHTSWTQPGMWKKRDWDLPDQPVAQVHWFEAEAYCRWLGKVGGAPVRLPTEAEWDRVKISPKHREGGQNSGNLLMLSGECAKGRNKRPRASLTWPKSNQQASRELHVQTW